MADTTFLKDNLAGFVPQEISYNIIGNTTFGSSVLRLAHTEIMKSNSKKFSVFATGASAFWVGESERITTTAPQWVFPELHAKKLAVIVPVTREKLNDSVINVFGEVQNKISEAFAAAIDSACLFGTNSPFTHSIYSAAHTNSAEIEIGTNAKLDLDISDAMAKVEAKAYEVKGFIADISFKNSLRKLRDGNGNPLYFNGALDKNGNRYDSLYSLPIEFNRNGAWDKTKALCICGDWQYAIVGIRENIEFEVLKEATLHSVTMADGKPLSLAENDMIGLKATMRLGFLPVKQDAFAMITPAA